MHEIQKWFNGQRDYRQGILLYSKYGRFSSVESMLRSLPDNRQSRELLEDHLQRLLDKANPKPDLPEKENPPKKVAAAKAILRQMCQKEKDLQVHELQQQANKLFAEMGAAQARLSAYATNEERAKAYQSFLELQKRWGEAQYKADVYADTGSLPTEPLYKPKERKKTKVDELSGSDYKKLTTLRSKVTRAEREQIPMYRTAPKYAAKLKKRLTDVEDWKKQIAQLEGGTHE